MEPTASTSGDRTNTKDVDSTDVEPAETDVKSDRNATSTTPVRTEPTTVSELSNNRTVAADGNQINEAEPSRDAKPLPSKPLARPDSSASDIDADTVKETAVAKAEVAKVELEANRPSTNIRPTDVAIADVDEVSDTIATVLPRPDVDVNSALVIDTEASVQRPVKTTESEATVTLSEVPDADESSTERASVSDVSEEVGATNEDKETLDANDGVASQTSGTKQSAKPFTRVRPDREMIVTDDDIIKEGHTTSAFHERIAKLNGLKTNPVGSGLAWSNWSGMEQQNINWFVPDPQKESTSLLFFSDATRVGLLLAAINHGNPKTRSIAAFLDATDDARSEGPPYSKDRRRRRAATGRRAPTSFERLRNLVNPMETIDAANALPCAAPSCDEVFADSAMMSVLYHEPLHESGTSRSRLSWLFGGFMGGAAGAAGVAARSGRGRQHSSRPSPAKPRYSGETLKFAN